MEGLRSYQKYLAIKLHFTTDYDYFKYGGKSRSASASSFEKRKDIIFFRKIERRYSDEELTDYFVANFVEDSTSRWIGDLSSLKSEKTYAAWKRKIESFSYEFKNEMISLRDISDNPASLWRVESNQHPKVLQLYLANKLSIESMLATNRVLKYIPMWDKKIEEQFIWPDISKRLKKYDSFLRLDTNKIEGIMKEVFHES
jgi:hypothetical protein